MTFPHTEVMIIVGPEGDRKVVITFTEKGNKLAIDCSWKGKMPINYLAYDKLAENKILKFLIANGIGLNSLTSQDFGKDKAASKKAIQDFLSSSDSH